MSDGRRFGLRRVMEVQPWVIEPTGAKHGQPFMAGGDRRAELDLLDAEGRQPLLAARSSVARATR